MVNGIMEKRIYYTPLVEVENIRFCGALLTSPTDSTLPSFPHPGTGAPARRDVVPVF